MTAHLVVCNSGEYSRFETWPVAVFTDKTAAATMANRLNALIEDWVTRSRETQEEWDSEPAELLSLDGRWRGRRAPTFDEPAPYSVVELPMDPNTS